MACTCTLTNVHTPPTTKKHLKSFIAVPAKPWPDSPALWTTESGALAPGRRVRPVGIRSETLLKDYGLERMPPQKDPRNSTTLGLFSANVAVPVVSGIHAVHPKWTGTPIDFLPAGPVSPETSCFRTRRAAQRRTRVEGASPRRSNPRRHGTDRCEALDAFG